MAWFRWFAESLARLLKGRGWVVRLVLALLLFAVVPTDVLERMILFVDMLQLFGLPLS